MVSGIPMQCMHEPLHVLEKLLCSGFVAFCCSHFVGVNEGTDLKYQNMER